MAPAFGLLGDLFKKLHYPLAPMVPGEKAGDAFRQAMIAAPGLPLLSLFRRGKPALAERSA